MADLLPFRHMMSPTLNLLMKATITTTASQPHRRKSATLDSAYTIALFFCLFGFLDHVNQGWAFELILGSGILRVLNKHEMSIQ